MRIVDLGPGRDTAGVPPRRIAWRGQPSPADRAGRRVTGRLLPAALAAHGPRLVRFGLVGGAGVGVNYALLALLVEVGGLHPLLAAALATEGAILSNFTLNNRWTFRDMDARTGLLGRAARYNLFALGGLAISVLVLGLLTTLLQLHYLLANLFAIGAATVWNYAANARWTWSTAPGGPPLARPEAERG